MRRRVAVPTLTVLNAGRRGVSIGLGPRMSVPSLPREDGDAPPPASGYAKQLIWDPDDGSWFYSYLSKGVPVRGQRIGIGDRGKIAYYKVKRSTPNLVELSLEKDQVFSPGSSASDFASILKFDADTFRNLRAPTWYRQVKLDKKNIPSNLHGLFEQAQALAMGAYNKYKKEVPSDSGSDSEPAISTYTNAFLAFNITRGRMEAYRELRLWADDLDGDDRTRAQILRHIDRELASLKEQADRQEETVKNLRKTVSKKYPELRAASVRLHAMGRLLCSS